MPRAAWQRNAPPPPRGPKGNAGPPQRVVARAAAREGQRGAARRQEAAERNARRDAQRNAQREEDGRAAAPGERGRVNVALPAAPGERGRENMARREIQNRFQEMRQDRGRQFALVREERQRHDELQELYEHLVLLPGLRERLVLLGQEYGYWLVGLVIAVGSMSLVVFVITPLLTVVSVFTLVYLPDFFFTLIEWIVFCAKTVVMGILAACALVGLLAFWNLIGRPLFHYVYYYRRRQRLIATQDECAVCLAGFDDEDDTAADADIGSGPSRVLICGHRFHRSCIEPWLSTHNYCPLCRAY